jgi:hypothetical protein
LLDKTIDVSQGAVTLAPDVEQRLEQVIQGFIAGLRAHGPVLPSLAPAGANALSSVWPDSVCCA